MSDKIRALIARIEDIISNIDTEPVKKLFAKLNLDRIFARDFSKKFLATAFTLIVVLISIVSLITVFSERIGNSPQETTSKQTPTDDTSAFAASKSAEDFKGNFLLLLDSEETEDVYMIAVVQLDSSENTMHISFINKNTTCSVNNISGSFTEHYNKGGMKQLVWAVGEYCNISIERYLAGDEDSFEKFCEMIGDISVNIPEKVSHAYNGISYIIDEGEQNLTPAIFLKYFLYLCSQDKGNSIADLMVLMGMSAFSAEDDEKLQDNIETLTHTFDTNISAVDFGTYKNALKKMASPETLPTVSIETDFEKFRQ